MTRVLFVAVNYYGASSITPFLDSLRQQQTTDLWALTIVDNSADTRERELLDRLTADDKDINVVSTPSNLGYFGAANWWHRQAPDSTWFVVSNTDLRLGNSFVAELLRSDGGQFVTAPAITHWPGGYQQNPFMTARPSVRLMRFRALMFQFRSVARLSGKLSSMRRKAGARPPSRGRHIYAAHGSILAIHRRFFDVGGTLEHATFMFGEEITIAEQVRRLGGRVWFEPALEVTHEASQATGVKRSKAIWRMQRDATRNSYRLIRAG